MIKLHINGEAVLDLLILHGESAVDEFFKCLKEEFESQVVMLKRSGKYAEYENELHQKIISRAT